ncbi:TetR family transcriptional regulator [Mycolicibacterium duvalii]|nr:TetR family transcriptional regulator [Mycolicibacterium duvalii]
MVAVTMLAMASTKREAGRHAPRTGPRVRRGTASALLLDAAQELFAERGPFATTTRQIADRAEVSEDLIFRYFGSKNALLQEAVVRPIVELLQSVTPRWEAAQGTWADNDHERFVNFVGQLFDLVYENRTVAMTMMQVLISGPAGIDDLAVRELAGQMYEPLAPMFADYLGRNGFRDNDPAILLRLIMILIGTSAAFLPGAYPDGVAVPDRDRIVDELATFIHYGLRRPG